MYSILTKTYFLRKLYFDRNEIEQTLLLSSLFSILLSFARVVYTRELLFLSLIWNLFLAFVPYAITKWCSYTVQWVESTPKFLVVIATWLLFIPNSFYIITDLFHLEERAGIPLWFDLALIFSFAWNGLLLGVLSVRQMEKLISIKWPFQNEWLFVVPIMFLNAFGIYLGRYLRYNSWDVISKPFGLAEDIVYLFVHPIRNRFDWSMIVCFALLMSFIYLSIKKLARH